MTQQYAQPPEMSIDLSKTYSAAIRTSHGVITVDLFTSDAPATVNNFVFLAKEGFYTNGKFHRVIKDFMVQGGCPKGDGTGGPGYKFNDEPVSRKYLKGTLAMANSGPNTNGSQFFIVHATDAGLPPAYTIFGQVTDGMDTVDALANTQVRPSARGEASIPTETLRIQSIEIIETAAQ